MHNYEELEALLEISHSRLRIHIAIVKSNAGIKPKLSLANKIRGLRSVATRHLCSKR